MLKSKDTIHLVDNSTVRPYEASKLNILQTKFTPVPLEDVLVGDELLAATHRLEYIVRDREINDGDCDIQPYTDPLLKDCQRMVA